MCHHTSCHPVLPQPQRKVSVTGTGHTADQSLRKLLELLRKEFAAGDAMKTDLRMLIWGYTFMKEFNMEHSTAERWRLKLHRER